MELAAAVVPVPETVPNVTTAPVIAASETQNDPSILSPPETQAVFQGEFFCLRGKIHPSVDARTELWRIGWSRTE
jgi:hypothetical protein